MFWGCVTWHGPGPYVPIKAHEKERFITISKGIRFLKWRLTRFTYLIETGPMYTGQIIGIKESFGLRNLELPPYSLDLNIIENIWLIWNDNVSKKHPQNLNQLAKLGRARSSQWAKLCSPYTLKNSNGFDSRRPKNLISLNIHKNRVSRLKYTKVCNAWSV